MQQGTFDLVILDLMLPDGDGEDILPLLNKPGQPSIPVIVFSAKDIPREVAKNIQAALTKSRTSTQDLLSIIRSTIQSRQVKG